MKTFGYSVPVRNDAGDIESYKPREISLATKAVLGGNYGPDKNKALVVSLRDGDVIAFRPLGRTKKAEVTIEAKDVYAVCLRYAANKRHLEKARNKKTAVAARRLAAKIRREDKKIIAQAKKEAV